MAHDETIMNKLRGILPELNRPPQVPILDDMSMGPAVPRILHQTFPHKNLPREIRHNIDSILALNPGWEHRLYDDGAIRHFIELAYGNKVLSLYDRIDDAYGAARADLFRYLLMYREGGIYLDIKSAATRRLDDVLERSGEYALSHWRNAAGEPFERWGLHHDLKHFPRGEFQQWFIVTAPGHPFLKAVIENVLRNIMIYNPALHGTGRVGVLRVTGPIAYTLAIAPILEHHAHRLVDSEVDLGLKYTIYAQDNLEAHFGLFKSHYTDLRQSVVKITFKRKLFVEVISMAKQAKRAFSSRERAL